MLNFQLYSEQQTIVCKLIIIQISQEDLEILKNGKYMLCIAMKVEKQAYDVIWQAYQDYMINNQIMLYPRYAAFGSQYFRNNSKVFVSTNIEDIIQGEITTVEQSGYLTSAVSGGQEQAINFDNQYNGIHLGIDQYLNDIFNKYICSPIFVSKNSFYPEQVHFIPEDKLLIWFEQGVTSGTMSSNILHCTGGGSMSELVEITLTQQDTTVQYVKGKWGKV